MTKYFINRGDYFTEYAVTHFLLLLPDIFLPSGDLLFSSRFYNRYTPLCDAGLTGDGPAQGYEGCKMGKDASGCR